MAIIFFDLDGTTLHRGKPAKGVIESIEALRKNNHIVAIATGRSPVVLYDKHKELGIDYLVLANGSLVMHNEDIIYARNFPNELIQRFMKYVDDINSDLVLEYSDEYVAYRKETDVVDKFSEIFNIEKPRVAHKFFPDRPVHAMVVFEHERIGQMRNDFPELLFNISNAMGYDVNLNGDLKAEGVKVLIDYLNIPMEDTYAIGDGHNDINMIKAVKHGIAMGNASDEVKEAAEFVTTDVNDYGVMNALKHYNLI